MFTASRRLAVFASHIRTPAPIYFAARPVVPRTTATVGSFFSTAEYDPATMGAIKEFVDNAIETEPVLVFSKSYCPYCKRAKAILNGLTPNVKVYELDEMDDGSAIQQYLKTLNGQSTVPNIYIRKEHIGGCSELQALSEAEVKKRIEGKA